MSDLTTKANGEKKVPSATDTKANVKNDIVKNEVLKPILEGIAEKRIKNKDIFDKICQKHSFLGKKADDLSTYLISRDGLKETLIIENSDGQTFEINNSNIIEEILIICQEKVFKLLEDSEKAVVSFQI